MTMHIICNYEFMLVHIEAHRKGTTYNAMGPDWHFFKYRIDGEWFDGEPYLEAGDPAYLRLCTKSSECRGFVTGQRF